MSDNSPRPSASVVLEAGSLEVELAPDIGGSVASFRMRRDNRLVDLLRPMTVAGWNAADPVLAAMFPMVPYANRIAGNRFEFEGREYAFQRNYSQEALNVHGSGWLSRWSVRQADGAFAELTLNHEDPADPYRYRASQRFELSPDGLVVRMKVSNRGDRRMPFGLGLHPWWARDDQLTLRFEASHFWLTSPDSIPTDRIATPPELDFSAARPLPRTWRNNAYGGWNGRAELLFQRERVGLKIEADPIFRHLLLYADPEQPVFCLEPQTNAVCAFNRMENEGEELGVVLLAPGEHVEGAIAFHPFSL
jgi:aldose 1-epimerase